MRLSRRALMGAAPAVAAIAAPAVALPPAGPVRQMWQAHERERARINAHDYGEDGDEAAIADVLKLDELTVLILTAQITSYDEAMAKLECAATMAQEGLRTDQRDADALADVARFLRRGERPCRSIEGELQ